MKGRAIVFRSGLHNSNATLALIVLPCFESLHAYATRFSFTALLLDQTRGRLLIWLGSV